MKWTKYLILGMVVLTGCKQWYPNHVGLEPSVEWELQEGTHVKTKPKVHGRLDWTL